MKHFLFVSLCVFAFCVQAQQKTITGFSKEAADAQFKLEEKFDAHLKAENLDQWLKKLTAGPHHVGSSYGKVNAEFMRDLFRSWGYEAEIESYRICLLYTSDAADE